MTKAEQAINMANRKDCEYCEGNNLPQRTNNNDQAGKGTWVHYNLNPPSGAQSTNAEAQICMASAEIEKAWAELSESN
jgi:hypothetical protein